ncbi:YicC/YloC family endoribonuclease [Feifania hominis]|uniref:YicC family protein n=1 Tax=Feifania hominis TaxID=2763660 RepID=A0A926DEZ6_9FIRM|nr:YicC/YloC family endoribonuclease [Feifania hominis]MBC8536971.1 YicC family protein [Feifania hominis]
MIKSMTGYGRAQALVGGKDITVEIKSVNHRYFDFSIRAPRIYGFLEEKLKTLTQKYISRGKVDVYVSVNVVEGPDADIQLNTSLLRSYLDALGRLSSEFGLKDDISVMSVARYSDIFTVVRAEENADELWCEVEQVALEAISSFMQMRTAEGERMYQDLLSREAYIEQVLEKIEAQSQNTLTDYRSRLYAKVKELLGDTQIDDSRILTEVALYADKIAVDEETVRLRSHLKQYLSMIGSDVPVGRKLDFLIQEMNREVNTIGSKSNNLTISQMVVDLKAEIEKIREQVQNIE